MTIDSDDNPRLRVLIDASKTVRCKWCGTTQSDDWKITGLGVYCSKKCFTAHNSQDIEPITIVCILGVFFGVNLVTFSIDANFGVLVFAILCFLLWYYASGYFENEDYKQEVPRNSRQDNGSIDVSLLRMTSSNITCPHCDASVDISHLEDDLVYYCNYCGASGLVEIVKINTEEK